MKFLYVTDVPLMDHHYSMTYSSVVSWDNVHIAFLVSLINDFGVLAGDIQDSYPNAPTKDKLQLYTGDEQKSDHERIVLIIWSLYGLKYSALMWNNHISNVLGNKLGLKYSPADPYVWYKAATDETGFEYYNYILVYFYDIIMREKIPKK